MSSTGDKFNGIGMTSTRTRARMIERVRELGVKDETVLAAMATVPRHIFVEEALASRAYEDSPLPIGAGQTISQPYVVARMTELLRAGTRVGKVRRNLRLLKVNNVRIKHGDGSSDLGEEIEVDGIIVTAAAREVPIMLLRYLKVGGRMVLPLARNDEELRGVQLLTVIEKGPTGIREQTYDAVRFVPLLPGTA